MLENSPESSLGNNRNNHISVSKELLEVLSQGIGLIEFKVPKALCQSPPRLGAEIMR
jgi:hypothetical protein